METYIKNWDSDDFVVPKWIKQAREQNKELEALVYGHNYKEFLIEKIEHLESEKHANNRKKYSKNTVALFARVGKPMAQCCTASGGMRKLFYENEKYAANLAKCKDGKSLKDWIKDTYLEVCKADANAVILIEREGEKLYPCYKSIQNIVNYECEGVLIKWVIFKHKDGYRAIDGMYDRYVTVSSDGVKVEDEIMHGFGYCPAVVAGQIKEPGVKLRKSLFWEILDEAKEYGRDSSMKSILKAKHGIPIFWQHWSKCQRCEGSGRIMVNTEENVKEGSCPDCKGTGWTFVKDVSDVIKLQATSDGSTVAPNVAGYVAPPIETLVQFNTEQDWMEDKMFATLWGSYLTEQGNNTATGKFIDSQPVAMQQGVIADYCQNCENAIAEIIARGHGYTQETPPYIAVYGKRFINESIDSLNDKYAKAKVSGNLSLLDATLRSIISLEYENNLYEMELAIRRMEIDYYPHYSLAECKALSDEDFNTKKIFEKWWKQASLDVYLPTKEQFDAYLEVELAKQQTIKEKENERLDTGTQGGAI